MNSQSNKQVEHWPDSEILNLTPFYDIERESSE